MKMSSVPRTVHAGGFLPSITVAVPTEEPTWRELGEMLIAQFTAQGHACALAYDGDLSARRSDVLLLVGSGRYYQVFSRQFRTYPAGRPHTILWHLEPLPPPLYTEKAERLGRKLVDAKWEDVFGDWATGLDRWLNPRGEVRRLLQHVLVLRFQQEMEKAGPGFGNVGASDIQAFLEESLWLEEMYRSPVRWIDEIHTDMPSRSMFLRQRGIPAEFTPIGYDPAWGVKQQAERDIDLLFLGDLSTLSRESAVPQVLEQIRYRGYKTLEIGSFPERAERTNAMVRSRVVMNILRLPWEFPSPRLTAAVACGALLVSNEAVHNDPYQAGTHFVSTTPERMAETIAYYLDHEEERRRLVQQARKALEGTMMLEHSVQRLLRSRSTTRTLRAAA